MAGNLVEPFVLVCFLLFMLGVEQKQTDFERFQSWLTQRLNGSVVNGKTARFNKTELIQFQNAIHDLGRKLSAIAFL